MKTRAKNAILGRLRAATAAGFPRVSVPTIPRKPGGGVADFQGFAAVLTTLGPTFELARTPEEARQAFAAYLAANDVKTAVRWDHPDLDAVAAASVLAEAKAAVIAPEELPERVCPGLAAVDLGVTAVAYALCATGSLVMAAAPGRERGTPLVPRLHVAFVAKSRLVPDLPTMLEKVGQGPMPSALNCVSGVSSTGDIEFVYVRGVHGPLAVHVIGLDWL
jgi:L-lactate dehydrogenase complex protein LldG